MIPILSTVFAARSIIGRLTGFFIANKYILIAAAVLLAGLYFLRKKVRKVFIRRLEYKRCFSDDGVYCGASLKLVEEITNRSFLPLFFVDMGFYVPAGLIVDGVDVPREEQNRYCSSRFHVMPFSRVVRTHRVVGQFRGHYCMDTVTVPIDSKNIHSFSAPCEVFVYPSMLSRLKRPINDFMMQGETISNSRFLKDPFLASGLREYRFGDPVNSVNFKASARSFKGGVRQLMVNNYDSSTNYNVMILFNYQIDSDVIQSSEEFETFAEYGLSYINTFLYQAYKNGGRVGFAANATKNAQSLAYVYHRCQGGNAHMVEILKSLATVENYTGFSFSALIDLIINDVASDTEVVIISSRKSDAAPERIAALRRKCRSVSTVSLTGAGR